MRVSDGHSGPETEASCRQMYLIFVNGTSEHFTLRQEVSTIQRPEVFALTCLFALLLALPENSFIPAPNSMWLRVVLNLASVAIFAALFPTVMKLAMERAKRRQKAQIYLPMVTIPTAAATVLLAEALLVLLQGQAEQTRTDLLIKIAIAASLWELHSLLFIKANLRAARLRAAPAPQGKNPRVEIGNSRLNPTQIRRIASDDHFLHIHLDTGRLRILATMSQADKALQSYGTMVHRQHWIAFREIETLERNGRAHAVFTKSRETIPVSRGRLKHVQDHLRDRAENDPL